jgi:hypothetical protein
LHQFAEAIILQHKLLLKPCHPFLATLKTKTQKRWGVLDQFTKTRIIKAYFEQESAPGSFACSTQAIVPSNPASVAGPTVILGDSLDPTAVGLEAVMH